jgi:glucosyl-3-phosphoglycerate synthase
MLDIDISVDADMVRLARLKRNQRVAVAIPARDEAGTIGTIVSEIVERLLEPHGLVDELVVVDDGSTDGTADAARAAGADVITTAREGKGQALRRAVEATDAELVVFLDADVANFTYRYVTMLLEPLLGDDSIVMVKPAYDRPLHERAHEGGRVTKLVARPLLEMFWPQLAHISQPLAGECAIRRRVLDHVVLEDGYAIEIGLLLDVCHRYGARSIVEVDLGERIHRNRPLHELAPQARTVMAAALKRSRY